jgi:serine/threonine protein kinase
VDSRVGTMFGKYRIVALLGKGGMGHVYEAYDTTKDRSVALKVLADQFSQDQEFLNRFQRESHAAAKLQEPHVIPIHDWGEINGEFYIDMRLVQGADLQQMIAQGPLAPERAVAVINQIASALDAAHAEGLIHRDVKPANIIVTPADFAYLVDFGIAEGKGDSRFTSDGFRVGSLAYMAPERFSNSPETPAVDVYSLTCVLHEALTGETPFPTNTTQQEIAAHLSLPPPQPSAVNSRVPASFDEVIARGMAKEPDDRYGSAGALGRAAERALQGGRSTGTGPNITAQVALPILGEPGPEMAQTEMLRPSSLGHSGPQAYPPTGSYPAEFTEQPWGSAAPPMYLPQGQPGYGPAAEPPPWPPGPPMGPPMGMPPQGPPPGSSGVGRAMVILAVVLLLAGIGVGVWLLLDRDKSDSTSQANGSSKSSQKSSQNGSSGNSTRSFTPPTPTTTKPRVPPPLLDGPDTNNTTCGLNYPNYSSTAWVSHAGRGSNTTSCTFAANVLDAYLRMGPTAPSLREVSAPGAVSCTQREADGARCDPANRRNFLMLCSANESPDWITCVGGVEAKVYLY